MKTKTTAEIKLEKQVSEDLVKIKNDIVDVFGNSEKFYRVFPKVVKMPLKKQVPYMKKYFNSITQGLDK